MSIFSKIGNFLTTAGGGGLAGSLLGLGGSAYSAKESAEEAQRNRDFQERMSNSAYQRSADDLEAAGLNRVLALGSPASTPGGAMAQVPDYGSAMATGANAGINAATSASQIGQAQASISKMVEETKGISTQNKIKLQQSQLWETLAPMLIETGRDTQALLNIMKTEAPNLMDAALKTAPQIVKDIKKVLVNAHGKAVLSATDWIDDNLGTTIETLKKVKY